MTPTDSPPDACLAARPATSGLSDCGTAPPPGEDADDGEDLRGRVLEEEEGGYVELPVTPPRITSRVTLLVQVYHQTPHNTPLAVRDQHGWQLQSEQPAFTRPGCIATESWTPIDLGWLRDEPAMVLISNDEGRELRQTHPSEAEKTALERKVLDVSFGGDEADLLIRPKMTQPMCPADPGSVRVRSQSGPCRFTVTVIPG